MNKISNLLLALTVAGLTTSIRGADGELQISVDGAPKHYAVHAGGAGNINEVDANGSYDRAVGVLIDMVIPMRFDGFSESVFPVGGIGLDYGYRSTTAVASHDFDLRFHYGLAIQPVRPVRLDLQVFLAPAISFAVLDTPTRPSAKGNWMLTGGTAGIEATLGVRINPWLGFLARGGGETRYVSGRNDRDNVDLHTSGAIAGAGVILIW